MKAVAVKIGVLLVVLFASITLIILSIGSDSSPDKMSPEDSLKKARAAKKKKAEQRKEEVEEILDEVEEILNDQDNGNEESEGRN